MPAKTNARKKTAQAIFKYTKMSKEQYEEFKKLADELDLELVEVSGPNKSVCSEAVR